MFPCVCSIIGHRRRQNVVRTSVTHSAIALLLLPHFDVICDLLLNRRTATWNLFINYIITQVILAFWLVLAYDLLEDRFTIDVIITKFLPLCFKMEGSFENLDNILLDWANDKVEKSLAEALNRIFSSTSIQLWWQEVTFFRIERASISITWNRGKCGDIQTSTIISNELGFWRRKPRLIMCATEISLLRSLVASQQ